ncbi:AGAP006440-PA-like protein [Anopheles sinensis]|uniref:AGAP006440-PA-like protein n=1 Tax=Anopheles sinensis TaxID=74873 RepID=A0A084WP64_ANOSI|nr:AGAP006440-PA-like protein [Anopheles sinensis]
MGDEFVDLSHRASVDRLFPDRLSNLSGSPYKVACCEDPALSYLNGKKKLVGLDIDFIDIIAKHQRTSVEYAYTPVPHKVFEPWYDRTIDFATYRMISRGTTKLLPFSALYFPNQYRWCVAVPKRYKRIIHEQVIWPFTVDLWMLMSGTVVFFFIYETMLQKLFSSRYPSVYSVINTPITIMRIMLLFLLSEYYTAILTSNLGLSRVPNYPKNLRELMKSNMPILTMQPYILEYIAEAPELASKIVEWSKTIRYDPFQYALVQMCDNFPYTIALATKNLGKELTRHHYHLIDEPIRTAIGYSPFEKTSPKVHRFQRYVSRLAEAGIWQYLIRKWNAIYSTSFHFYVDSDMASSLLYLNHFVPVFIVASYIYVLAIIIWPYTPSLWLLITSISACFIVYHLLLKDLLLKYFPNIFPIINTPLHILRILLLFLLTEYYTANLTAILGVSQVSVYPKTLDEFARSPIPLIMSAPDDYQYVRENPEVRAKTIEWNFSKTYDPAGMALIQLCDLFPYTIDHTTSLMGKRFGYRHYHLIGEPIVRTIVISPFLKTSPLMARFQKFVCRLNEAGIWDHLVRKWVALSRWPNAEDVDLADGKQGMFTQRSTILQLEHFTPVFLLAGYVYLVAVVVFLLEIAVHRILRRFNSAGRGFVAWG